MPRVNINDLFESLFTPELEATYVHPDIAESLYTIEVLKEVLNNPVPDKTQRGDVSEEEYIRNIKDEIKVQENKIKEQKKKLKLPEVKILFTKLTLSELKKVEDESTNEAQKVLLGYNDEVTNSERERLRLILDPSGIFHTDLNITDADGESVNELRDSTIEKVIERILMTEGLGEDDIADIADDDPEMELTESQEKALEIDERADPDERARMTIEMPKLRQQMLDEKRKMILDKRKKEREERKAKLEGRGFEALIDILLRYRLLSEASRKGAEVKNDLLIYYSAKLPREKSKEEPERFFENVGDVAKTREKYEHFYNWMLQSYFELQQIRTQEDIERVSRSALFHYGL